MNLGELIAAEIGVDEGLFAGDNAVPEAIVEAAVVLAVNVTLGVEPVDLAGEPGRKLGRIEPINRADPTLAREQPVVVLIDLVPENRDQTHARNHDPLLRVVLALRGGDVDNDGSAAAAEAAAAARGGEMEMGFGFGLVFEKWSKRRWAETRWRRRLKRLHGEVVTMITMRWFLCVFGGFKERRRKNNNFLQQQLYHES